MSTNVSFSNLRRLSSENPVDVVLAFSQAGTMLAIYMDEMRQVPLGGSNGVPSWSWVDKSFQQKGFEIHGFQLVYFNYRRYVKYSCIDFIFMYCRIGISTYGSRYEKTQPSNMSNLGGIYLQPCQIGTPRKTWVVATNLQLFHDCSALELDRLIFFLKMAMLISLECRWSLQRYHIPWKLLHLSIILYLLPQEGPSWVKHEQKIRKKYMEKTYEIDSNLQNGRFQWLFGSILTAQLPPARVWMSHFTCQCHRNAVVPFALLWSSTNPWNILKYQAHIIT